MNIFAAMALINVATSIVIGLLVVFADRRARLNQLFAFFAFAVAFWSYSYFSWQVATNATEAIFWVHALMAGAIFITPVYFHFTTHLLGIAKRMREVIFVGYIFIAIFSFLNWTPYYVSGLTQIAGFQFWPIAGPFFLPYLIVWVIYAFLPVLLLLRDLFGGHAQNVSTVRLVLAGTIIGYAGGCTNYFLWYGIPLLPFGNVSASVYIALVAYAIMKNKLFNMKVIATELLIFALWLVIFTRLLVAESFPQQVIEGSVLAVTLVIGVLLIRSVDREVEQREKIEQQEKELEIANRQQEGLLHFISHEIKGYLTKNEAAFAAIAAEDFGPVTPQLKAMSESALADTRKGVDTVMDILDASNLKKGTVAYKKLPFDLCATVAQIVAELKPAAKEKSIALSVRCSPDPLMMEGDEDKIRRHVIRNVIDNAIKYTPRGRIDITLAREGAKAVLTSVDTGVGITPEDMKRLFTEGGHGAESIKVNVHSTGYGLYIAKQIAEAHGGTIRADSEGKGKGSRFTIELPLA